MDFSSDQGSSKGKAVDATTAAGPTTNGGFQSQGHMRVEPPKREDLQKSYASVIEEVHFPGWYGAMRHGLGEMIGAMGAIPCVICCPNPFKEVGQGSVGLVTKFGRFYKAVDPGLVKVNPLSERLLQVDVKIQIVEVPKQVCMTKDNVTLQLTSSSPPFIPFPPPTLTNPFPTPQALSTTTSSPRTKPPSASPTSAKPSSNAPKPPCATSSARACSKT